MPKCNSSEPFRFPCFGLCLFVILVTVIGGVGGVGEGGLRILNRFITGTE